MKQAVRLLVLSTIVCGLGGSTRAEAQSGANVLIVANERAPEGDTLVQHYVARRAVPAANICHVATTTDETIARDAYQAQIERPIWRCIAAAQAQDRILYIVLTKGIPIRIEGTAGRNGTVASVDSELTLLYRRATGQPTPVVGFVPNPYFAGNAPIATLKSFTHAQQDIYLVTRLDGYTVEDALALIDRAAAPVRNGRIVLDERSSWTDNGNAWLRGAATRLGAQGLGAQVELDESSKVVTNEPTVLGYYSWGSNDPAIRIRHFGLGFVPGALAAMFVSSDARTFKEPPPQWTPSDSAKPDQQFGGTPQSLIADFIRDGVTGAAGHVAEPYLDATIRPDILFPAYVSGMNLAEAFYAAMPYLSWQTVVIGDPLCAPFRQHPLAAGDIDAGLNHATELPTYYSVRRQATMARTIAPDAAAAFLQAEARIERNEPPAAIRQSFEAAVAADSHFTAARLAVASRDQQEGRVDDAIAQYRAILAYAPKEVGVLNNLAYALATSQHAPQEALPLAEQAVAIAGNSPPLLDTLAWTLHLLNRDVDGAAPMDRALTAGANTAEVHWHAAVIYAAIHDEARATRELDAAVKLDPHIAGDSDINELRERLKGLKASGQP